MVVRRGPEGRDICFLFNDYSTARAYAYNAAYVSSYKCVLVIWTARYLVRM